MKIFPVVLISSIAANGMLFLVLRSLPSPRAQPIPDIVTPYAGTRSPELPMQAAGARSATSVDAGHGEKSGEGSTWKELQSDNLGIFVARLRAAGFPPRVVCAIVSSLVNERFLSQREDLLGDVPEAPFWKPTANAFNEPEKVAALNKFNRERDDLLKELLGPDAQLGDELQEVYLRRQYGDLPPEKMRRLQDVLGDYRELRMQLQPPNEPVTAKELEKLGALDREMRSDVAKLLTPQELEQFDLRSSPTASQLRHRLDAFRPSESEYRAIFQLTLGIEGRFPFTGDVLDPQQIAARRVAEQEVQHQLKAMLGPDRYADYQQATNPDHRTLNQLVCRFDLPLSAARDVVAVQRDITNRARALSSNNTILPAERDAQILALSREAFAKLGAVLTSRGLEAYKQHGGTWLAALKPTPARAPR